MSVDGVLKVFNSFAVAASVGKRHHDRGVTFCTRELRSRATVGEKINMTKYLRHTESASQVSEFDEVIVFVDCRGVYDINKVSVIFHEVSTWMSLKERSSWVKSTDSTRFPAEWM